MEWNQSTSTRATPRLITMPPRSTSLKTDGLQGEPRHGAKLKRHFDRQAFELCEIDFT